jgi:uncharacterized protein involved in exopolysaccharide biosynthesis
MTEEVSLLRKITQPSSVSMRDVLSVMFRQRRVVVLCFAAIFFSAVLYGWLAPSYQAQMKFLVRKGRFDPLITPAPTPSPTFERGDISEEDLNSEVGLLHDEDVLRTVVNTTGLANATGFLSRLRKDSDDVRFERAVRRLGHRLKAESVRKTNLISVSYSSSDPMESERVLRSLAAAYLQRHLQLRRPMGELKFFDQQVTQSKTALDEAQRRLTDFIRSHRVVSASLERDLALQKLSDAESSRMQTQVAMADNAERIRVLQAKLASMPPTRTAQVRTADNPLLLDKMKSKLLELQLRHTELLIEFKPSYRLVKQIEQQIEDTKASIAAEHLAPVHDETTEQDPTHDWAQAELVKAEVELDALRARENISAALLRDSRANAQQLGTDSIHQEELLRNLKVAEEKYLLYGGKREESRIGDALDQGGILNVAIAEQPTVPALPVRSLWSFAFFGFVFAAVASTTVAFTIDFLDPAFRTADEVVSFLGAPVLATLPQKKPLRGRVA